MPATSLIDRERTLPLVVEPDHGPGAPVDAPASVDWLGEHRDWIEERLLTHGALLFRGFPVGDAGEFESFAAALSNELSDYTRGNSPRHAVSGNVYSSTDLAPFMVIPLHNELSYSSNYPSRVFLFCRTPPTSGGQTPVADSRRILRALPDGVRERFAARGVRYIQNLPRRAGRFRPRAWTTMFGTEHTDEVERLCEGLGIGTVWLAGDRLRLTNTRAAETVHPVTGDAVWFNQAHVFHRIWSTEMRRVGRRAAAALFRMMESLSARRGVESLPQHALYGDGSEIGDDIERVREALWSEAVLFDWQAGDVLVLDNLLAAHGRMPYRGERRILAALGN